MRIPYSQQFTPKQTPLRRLLPVIRQHKKNLAELRKAIAAAFFKNKADPAKLAGNTLIALRTYGIIDENGLTAFGNQFVASQKPGEEEAHRLLAKRILVELGGVAVIETLREMNQAGKHIDLQTLPTELKARGIEVSQNSSDLSSVLGWLREAEVLDNYSVNEHRYGELVGMSVGVLSALNTLAPEQVAFLRGMVALNITDWSPYNVICQQAEALYPGQVRFNWKEIVAEILNPLQDAGLIAVRKRTKQAQDTPKGRGGKPADVKPTAKFDKEVAEPLLKKLYEAAGYAAIREIRRKSLAEIVNEIEQSSDHNRRGKALELLAIRLCQMFDLDFMGWRQTDEEIAGGGEVDAMLHSARLIYSRWQIQCKVGRISMEAVAKEVGMQTITLANVILLVGTKKVTDSALTYRRKIVSTTNLNIIILDGPLLKRIIEDNAMLVQILENQAKDALKLKPAPGNLRGSPPSGASPEGEPPQGSGNPASPRSDGESSAPNLLEPSYSTKIGTCYCGDALEILPALAAKGVRAKLIMTSPPFALVRKKDYGNEDADNYVRWFERFIPFFKQVLSPDGSLVIDIGGAWIKGVPAKATYHFKLLIRLCESGFFLAQDFYHYNPARLPTPAEWVTVRRLRVKDAVNNVWWLVLDPFVKADNRRVLKPYSEAMKHLLRNGYQPRKRPSGHDISDKFQRDNHGAIPPNVLQFANTGSNSYYLRRCKEENLNPHPARYPEELPAFFMDFLTEPGDLVLDPFAGSNVTGAVAESLGRQWVSIELNRDYVRASQIRFEQIPYSNNGAAQLRKGERPASIPEQRSLFPISPTKLNARVQKPPPDPG